MAHTVAPEAFEANPEFKGMVQRFREKVAEFEKVYQAMQAKASIAQADPELHAEYQTLMSRATLLRTTIQKAMEAIDWVRFQINQAGDAVSGLGNLGVIPLVAWGVAVAAVGGAISAMSYWLSGAHEWSKRAQIAEQIAAAGGTPEEISKALAEPAISWWALLGLAGIGAAVWWWNR